MPADTFETLERQWTLLRAIPRHPQSICVSRLVEHLRDKGFTTTRRTIERDLQNLPARFPLQVDESEKPYRWSWMKDASFEFMPSLTIAQAVALKLLQKHDPHLVPQAMLDELAPVFATADRELANSDWKEFAARTAVVPTTPMLLPAVVDPVVLADVQRATARRVCLDAHYQTSHQGTPTPMRIHPLGVIDRGPTRYLVCMIEGRARVRTLALQRMSRTRVDHARCEEPRGFDFNAWVENYTIAARGPKIRLRILLDAPAAEHLRETPLSKDQKWKPVPGTGQVEIRATVHDDDQLRWWLFSFVGKLEVIKPVGLRREIAQAFAQAAQRYSGTAD